MVSMEFVCVPWPVVGEDRLVWLQQKYLLPETASLIDASRWRLLQKADRRQLCGFGSCLVAAAGIRSWPVGLCLCRYCESLLQMRRETRLCGRLLASKELKQSVDCHGYL